MKQKQYLTALALAQHLDVDRYRVYEWVRDGQIPYLRTVGRILFDPDEIEQWLRRDRKELNQNATKLDASVEA